MTMPIATLVTATSPILLSQPQTFPISVGSASILEGNNSTSCAEVLDSRCRKRFASFIEPSSFYSCSNTTSPDCADLANHVVVAIHRVSSVQTVVEAGPDVNIVGGGVFGGRQGCTPVIKTMYTGDGAVSGRRGICRGWLGDSSKHCCFYSAIDMVSRFTFSGPLDLYALHS